MRPRRIAAENELLVAFLMGAIHPSMRPRRIAAENLDAKIANGTITNALQ